MKFNLLRKAILLFAIILLQSCSDDFDEGRSLKTENTINYDQNFKIIDGRLNFKSQKDFDQTIDLISRLSDDEKSQFFKPIYKNGFIPLTPFLDNSNTNDEFIKSYFDEKVKYSPDEFDLSEYSLEDPLIASSNLSSLLNIKREVVINNNIHAFTYSGLVMTNIDNTKNMYKFIKSLDGYKTLRSPDEAYSKISLSKNYNDLELWIDPNTLSNSKCYEEPIAYLSDGHDQIMHQPLQPGCGGGGGGGGSYDPPAPPTNPLLASTQSMIDFMNEQDACDYEEGSGLFGTNVLCFDYFIGGKRRTRSKYFSNNYEFYQEMGVKVKHQRKRGALGITYWDRKETDEVAVIVNKATYLKSAPNSIGGIGIHEFQFPSTNSRPVYWVGNKSYNYTGGSVSIPTLGYGSGLVPETPFEDDIIIHVIKDGFNSDLANINWNGDFEVTSEDLNEYFYDVIYDNAKTVYKSIAGNENEEPSKFSLVVSTPNKMLVQHIDVRTRRLNENTITKIFESDFGGEIGISLAVEGFSLKVLDDVAQYTMDGTSSFSFGPTKLDDYDSIHVDFYGLSRRGDEWRGNRLIYENL